MFEPDERRIVKRIKDFIKKKEPPEYVYIMLRNGRILAFNYYYKMVDSGKINPRDAYVYIRTDWLRNRATFYYPFLALDGEIPNAYLSKLGFNFLFFTAPATGLKYAAAAAIDFHAGRYLSIEVVNLDTAVSNTNLRTITFEVLGDKLISGEKELTLEEHEKIYNMYKSQKLFAGYDFEEAWDIIKDYYYKGNKSLAKEVARIAMDYYDIFHPYRVCYNVEKWKEIDCLSVKL